VAALQIVSVEVEQIERNHHDLGRSPLQLILRNRKVPASVGRRRDDFAVDNRGASANMPGVGGDLREPPMPRLLPSDQCPKCRGPMKRTPSLLGALYPRERCDADDPIEVAKPWVDRERT
jgi:hypothetical protein